MDRGARICILGAGAAGLSAAWYFRERGYRNVRVLERASEVGGKCLSVQHGDRVFEMGSIEVFPSYRRVRSFLKRYGMTVEPIQSYDLIDPTNGVAAPLSQVHNGLPMGERAAFFRDVARYFFIRRRYAQFVDDPAGVRIGPDGHLASPFDAFLARHGLQRLERLFHIPVTNYGYGFLDEIPAAYALRYLRPGMLDAFIAYGLGRRKSIGWLSRLGYQGLLRAIATDLGDIVRTGATRVSVTRDGDVHVRVDDGPSEPYDLILVSSPEAAAALDLRDDERDALSRVTCSNYATFLFDAEGIAPGGHGFNLDGRGAVVAPPDAGPVQMVRPWNDRPEVVCYAYARDPAVSLERLEARCREAFLQVGGRVTRVLDARAWRYFPHLDCAALKDGWADRLHALQRCHPRTRWLGSLFAFEIVEDVMAHAAHVVDLCVGDLEKEAVAARSK